MNIFGLNYELPENVTGRKKGFMSQLKYIIKYIIELCQSKVN